MNARVQSAALSPSLVRPLSPLPFPPSVHALSMRSSPNPIPGVGAAAVARDHPGHSQFGGRYRRRRVTGRSVLERLGKIIPGVICLKQVLWIISIRFPCHRM